MIKVDNLFFKILQKQILTAITLEVNPSQILAVVGESGSGKTTLLRLLATHLVPTSGKVLLEESDLIIYSTHLIKGHPSIKIVAQDFELFPNLSVSENICYSIRNYTQNYQAERLDHLLRVCNLVGIKDSLPKNISGGEKQRTAIAKAIADEPKVLLLDEPFSQLDSIHKQSFKAMLSELINTENIACVFVTHDLVDALTLATNIGIMKDGKMIDLLSVEDIMSKPVNSYTEFFIEAALQPLKYLENKLKLNRL